MGDQIEKIAILMSITATALTAAVFAYTTFIFQKPIPTNEEGLNELKEEIAAISIPMTYDIDKIVINLRSSKRKRLRFLDLSLHIIPFDQQQQEVLENNKALLHDSIIDIGGHMKPEELNSVAGKILFETRVKKLINEKLGEPVVKEILFSKFVVQ